MRARLRLPWSRLPRSRGHRALRLAVAVGAISLAVVAVRSPHTLIRIARGDTPRQTVATVLKQHRDDVTTRFRPLLEKTGQAWPPKRLQLLAFKHEQRLEVWAGDKRSSLVRLATYPFTAMSGELGPKAKQGDLQIPEGIYGLPVLNPNSSYHLSIRVNYPNADDVARANKARPPISRRGMGGDIYIHGEDVTIGCIPLGNPGIDEVFTLAALVKPSRRGVIIAPVDFRRDVPDDVTLPSYPKLYDKLRAALASYPLSD